MAALYRRDFSNHSPTLLAARRPSQSIRGQRIMGRHGPESPAVFNLTIRVFWGDTNHLHMSIDKGQVRCANTSHAPLEKHRCRALPAHVTSRAQVSFY